MKPPTLARTHSTEELTLLAELAGSASFPGTGEHVLTDEQRDPARRALLARGTLAADSEDGRPHVDAVDARLITIALHPDAVITAARNHEAGRERLHVYVADELSVAHRAAAAGVHRLEGLPTPLVGAAIGRFTNLKDRPVQSDEPITLTRGEFERAKADAGNGGGTSGMAGLLGALVSSCRVRVIPTSGSRLSGADLTWFDCGDRGNWLVEPGEEGVTARPVDLVELSGAFEDCWR